MSRSVRQLVGKFFAQRASRDSLLSSLADVAAVTFRPGRRCDTFAESTLQRAGIAVMFTLSYDAHADAPIKMPVHAYGATIGPDGRISRGESHRRLSIDLGRRPKPGGRGKVIDPVRNPTLLQVALQMDASCQAAARARRSVCRSVRMPRVLLGFPPSSPPSFQDTPRLRQITARKLGVPVAELGRNGDTLLSRLLQDVWHAELIPADAKCNSTGNLLMDRELCPSAARFIGMFEDFGDLLGVHVWNPIRDVSTVAFANPSRDVWRELGYENLPDLNQTFSDQTLAAVEDRMRAALPPGYPESFTKEDIFDGLTAP